MAGLVFASVVFASLVTAAGAALAQVPTSPAVPPPPPPRLGTGPATAAAVTPPPASSAAASSVPAEARRPTSTPSACEPTRTLAGGTAARIAPPTQPAPEDRAAPAAAATAADGRNEPRVECIVIDEDANRIEELRVRGQTQRIVVRPKDGGLPYEIQILDAGRDPSAKSGPGRGGSGQRVWPVLSF
jgi:hypothetical protein